MKERLHSGSARCQPELSACGRFNDRADGTADGYRDTPLSRSKGISNWPNSSIRPSRRSPKKSGGREKTASRPALIGESRPRRKWLGEGCPFNRVREGATGPSSGLLRAKREGATGPSSGHLERRSLYATAARPARHEARGPVVPDRPPRHYRGKRSCAAAWWIARADIWSAVARPRSLPVLRDNEARRSARRQNHPNAIRALTPPTDPTAPRAAPAPASPRTRPQPTAA